LTPQEAVYIFYFTVISHFWTRRNTQKNLKIVVVFNPFSGQRYQIMQVQFQLLFYYFGHFHSLFGHFCVPKPLKLTVEFQVSTREEKNNNSAVTKLKTQK
jgi:hypothetical protein